MSWNVDVAFYNNVWLIFEELFTFCILLFYAGLQNVYWSLLKCCTLKLFGFSFTSSFNLMLLCFFVLRIYCFFSDSWIKFKRWYRFRLLDFKISLWCICYRDAWHCLIVMMNRKFIDVNSRQQILSLQRSTIPRKMSVHNLFTNSSYISSLRAILLLFCNDYLIDFTTISLTFLRSWHFSVFNKVTIYTTS